jgi:drug/metabolite transporter (DMT)-like permease
MFVHHRRRVRHIGRAGDLLTDPAQEQQRQRLTGIALMCGAVFLFAGNDASAKYLNAYMATIEVVWARYASAFVLGIVMSNPLTRPQLLRTNRPWLQIGRSALLVVSTTLNFIALRYLQLDEALAIIFSTPFLVALMGGPLLGEWVKWRRWTAIIVGFLGVILVTRPGAGGIHPAAFLSFGAAVCYSLYSISTRVLAAFDSSETTLFYSNLVGFVVTSIALPFVWTTPTGPLIIILMIGMGAFSGVGHYLLIIAHRLAPAAVVAPFIYTEIVWMIALGYVVFGDQPNRWTLAGAAVVVASGLYLLYRERKVREET